MSMIQQAATQTPAREASYERSDAFMTMGEYEERFRTQHHRCIKSSPPFRDQKRHDGEAGVSGLPQSAIPRNRANTPCGLAFQPRQLNRPRPRSAGNAATRLPAFAARLMTCTARWRAPTRT